MKRRAFQNPIFLQNIKKLERGFFGDLKKIEKKVSQRRINKHEKMLVEARTHVLLLLRPQNSG